MKDRDALSPRLKRRMRDFRRNTRVIFRAGMVGVVASFLYEFSFNLFGFLRGDSFIDAFLSQFTLQGWLDFWTSPLGTIATVIYVIVMAVAVFSIFRPQIWTGNYANPFRD